MAEVGFVTVCGVLVEITPCGMDVCQFAPVQSTTVEGHLYCTAI
jgi:hypothetical protein